jgi:hypothetical protein
MGTPSPKRDAQIGNRLRRICLPTFLSSSQSPLRRGPAKAARRRPNLARSLLFGGRALAADARPAAAEAAAGASNASKARPRLLRMLAADSPTWKESLTSLSENKASNGTTFRGSCRRGSCLNERLQRRRQLRPNSAALHTQTAAVRDLLAQKTIIEKMIRDFSRRESCIQNLRERLPLLRP